MPKARNNDATAPPPVKQVKVNLPLDYHKRLRKRAIDTDTPASRLAQQVIEQFLDGLDAKTPDGGTSGEKIA